MWRGFQPTIKSAPTDVGYYNTDQKNSQCGKLVETAPVQQGEPCDLGFDEKCQTGWKILARGLEPCLFSLSLPTSELGQHPKTTSESSGGITTANLALWPSIEQCHIWYYYHRYIHRSSPVPVAEEKTNLMAGFQGAFFTGSTSPLV